MSLNIRDVLRLAATDRFKQKNRNEQKGKKKWLQKNKKQHVWTDRIRNQRSREEEEEKEIIFLINQWIVYKMSDPLLRSLILSDQDKDIQFIVHVWNRKASDPQILKAATSKYFAFLLKMSRFLK